MARRIQAGGKFAAQFLRDGAERKALQSSRPEPVKLTVDHVSDDIDYLSGKSWGLYGDQTSIVSRFGSQAGEAWAAGHIGSVKVAVGVIDSGVDYTHPDLHLNIWLNQGEISTSLRGLLVDTDADQLITLRDLNSPLNGGAVTDHNANGRIDAGDLLRDSRWANGIDEDGNGYRDDLVGWDFANNDNDPFDDHGHGTHVAGTIGATGGNALGVAGVAWNVQLVPLKFMDAAGVGYSDAAARAVDYFTNAKRSNPLTDFAATNNSWGGSGYTQQLQDAILRAAKADILYVASAGNGGGDRVGDNNDLTPYYPSSYSSLSAAGYDAVISVAALTSSGLLAGYSNFGATSVEIAAPGSGIWSTTRGGGFGSMSGTSMAAPHVAGAIALFSAAHPEYSAAQIRSELLSSAMQLTSLSGKVASGGTLDVASFLADPGPLWPAAPAPTPTPTPMPAPTPTQPTIYGTSGSETVTGTSVAERIFGVAASGKNPGRSSIDLLVGQGGSDTFMLSDARGLFYNDGKGSSAGRNDYAQILDFGDGDRIQLSGDLSSYHIRGETISGRAGMSIYYDSNSDKSFDACDELIAHVANVTTIAPEHFIFG